MSQMGRPPKPEAERLTEFFHIRVTKAEFDAACRGAMRSREGLGAYLRAVLRPALSRETKSTDSREVS